MRFKPGPISPWTRLVSQFNSTIGPFDPKHAISAYDAMYVAVAQRLKLKIATHDSRLARNLAGRGMAKLLLPAAALPEAE